MIFREVTEKVGETLAFTYHPGVEYRLGAQTG
jgi:hypothetical protein